MIGRIGKYELLEKISEGGMGELFRARAIGPGGFERVVALKRIRSASDKDETFIEMFVEEAKVASLLSHQNLVHLYDFGSEGEVHYLAMEMVEGRDLAKVLVRARQARTPFPIPAAVRVAHQTLLGLDYLHRLRHRNEALQLVHRDVSPQNIMLSFDGVVKLTDFGIARMKRQERLTHVGVVKGKLGYLSPEQIADLPIDSRSDLFSLGIVLWECLTGARLFPGTANVEVVRQVLQKPLRPPSTLNAEVPKALDEVVMHALERDRERRFASAAAMAQALADLPQPMASDAAVAAELRRLFPEHAGERLLGLGSSAELSAPPASTRPERLRPERLQSERGPRAKLGPQHKLLSGDLTAAKQTQATEALDAAQRETLTELATVAEPTLERRRFLTWRQLAAGTGIGLLVAFAVALGFLRRAPAASGLRVTQAPILAPAAAVTDGPSPIPTSAPPVASPPPAPSPAPAPTPAPSPSPTPPAATAPASEATSAPVRKAAPATLRVIDLHPWAEVLVDGKSKGFSPGHWPVSPRVHQVRLVNPDAHIERRFELRFAPGKTFTLSGNLETLLGPSSEP